MPDLDKNKQPPQNQNVDNKEEKKLSVPLRALGVIASPLIFAADLVIYTLRSILSPIGVFKFMCTVNVPKKDNPSVIESKISLNPLRYIGAVIVSAVYVAVSTIATPFYALYNLYNNIKDSVNGKAPQLGVSKDAEKQKKAQEDLEKVIKKQKEVAINDEKVFESMRDQQAAFFSPFFMPSFMQMPNPSPTQQPKGPTVEEIPTVGSDKPLKQSPKIEELDDENKPSNPGQPFTSKAKPNSQNHQGPGRELK